MQALGIILSVLVYSNLASAHNEVKSQQSRQAPQKESTSPAQDCLVDICGIPSRANLHQARVAKRLEELNEIEGEEYGSLFSPEMQKQVGKYLAEDEANTKALIDSMKRAKADRNAQLEGIPKVLFRLGTLGKSALPAVKYKPIIEDGRKVPTVDEVASRAAMIGVPLEDQSDAIEQARHGLKVMRTPGALDPKLVNSKPPEVTIHVLHPKDNAAEGLKAEFKIAEERVAQIMKDRDPLARGIYFPSLSLGQLKAIGRHIQDGSVDENEVRELIKWNQNYIHAQTIVQSPLAKKAGPKMEEILDSFGGREKAIDKIQNNLRERRERLADYIGDCERQYFMNKGVLPTADQNRNLGRDIAKAKSSIIKMIKEQFPPDSRNKMISAIQSAKFILPKTKDEYETELSRNLNEQSSALRADTENTKKFSGGQARSLIPALTMIDSKKDKDKGTDRLMNPICGSFYYPVVDDANYTTMGSIKLSYSTATTDEESRLATIMHELGHGLSKAISDDPDLKSKFVGVRKCLTDQHTEKHLLETIPGEDGQYTEEDFADTVAGTARGRHPGKNAWCTMLNADLKNNSYQDREIVEYEPDPHSSSLFRLLNVEYMKAGKLPERCNQYLKFAKYMANFRDCFSLAKAQFPTEGAGSASKK